MSLKYMLLVLLFACGTTTPEQDDVSQPTSAEPASASDIRITVITSADNRTRLPGAEAFIIHGNGRVDRAGMTDQFGHVVIQREALARPEGPSIGVMVCHPVFYCGIVRTEELTLRADPTLALATRVIR